MASTGSLRVGQNCPQVRYRVARRSRHGAITVLSALLLIIMLAMAAFAIDFGFILAGRTELQRAADSAALAAAWELISEDTLLSGASMDNTFLQARVVADAYSQSNTVLQTACRPDTNAANSANGDIVIGELQDLSVPDAPMYFSQPKRYNAVRVRIRRHEAGESPQNCPSVEPTQSHAEQTVSGQS